MTRAVITACACLVLHSASVVADADTHAFVNVTTLPMIEESPVTERAQTVVIRGDRIIAVGPTASTSVPDGATTIDGAGAYLLPGLAEMHGHVPPPSRPASETHDTLFLYLANGITTVRGMLGAEGQLELRERVHGGGVLSPTLYLAGPSFNGNSVTSPEQARRMVARQVDAGWNLLKVHPGLTRDEYDAMAAAANAAGIRFGGHVPAEVGLRHALTQGQETFDHVDGYVREILDEDGGFDEVTLAALIAETLARDAWIVPTMALWEVLYGTIDSNQLVRYDELRYVSTRTRELWESRVAARRGASDFDLARSEAVIDARMRILRALDLAGVRILMGTDAPQLFSVPGFSLHRELERMSAVGMSNYAILLSGTKRVGEYFANEDAFGTIAPGQRADLLLSERNPLDDLAHLRAPKGVMVRGRWVPAEALEGRLATIAAKHDR